MRILTLLLALCCALFLGYFELHTDDAGVLVFFLLTSAFVLGAIHPKHAWLWALILAESIPIADIWNTGHTTIESVGESAGSAALLILFVTGVGMAGAYGGVLVRKAVFDSHKNSA